MVLASEKGIKLLENKDWRTTYSLHHGHVLKDIFECGKTKDIFE